MPASYVTEKESINGPFIIKSYGNVDLSWETLFLEWSHSHLLLLLYFYKLREITLSPTRGFVSSGVAGPLPTIRWIQI